VDQIGAIDEIPVLFEAEEDLLFGVLTRPPDSARGIGVILHQGAGIFHTNHNRTWVCLSRRLARLGYHALRYDYHGVGESTGSVPGYDLLAPFTVDLRCALRCLEEFGVNRFVVMGSCFGGRTALALAQDGPGIAGVIVLDLPLDERTASPPGARRAGALQTRVPAILADLEAVVLRGIHLLLVYGSEDESYAGLRKEAFNDLERILRQASPPSAIRVLDGRLHGLPDLKIQMALADLTVSWLSESVGRGND